MQHHNDVEELVHLYIDGAFNRRELVKRLAGITGSVAAAVAALDALQVPAEAQTPACVDARVPEGVPDVDTAAVDFTGEAGTLFGYWTRPKPMPDNPLGAVLVIHENRGLTDYVKDVTRRVARAGYVGLAIDLLSRQGGTARFPDPVDAMNAYNRTRAPENLSDMLSALAWLKTLDYVAANRLGVIGFCAGGGNVTTLVVNTKDLAAAVAYYPGSMPTAQDITDKLSTPVMFNLGQLDTAVTNRVAAVLPAMLTGNKTFALHIYEGARHAFHNDTGAAYEPVAACAAWNLTTEYFAKYLRKVA
jgi:carboxymethylenebutenolidase